MFGAGQEDEETYDYSFLKLGSSLPLSRESS
jgi:hypothetical protein